MTLIPNYPTDLINMLREFEQLSRKLHDLLSSMEATTSMEVKTDSNQLEPPDSAVDLKNNRALTLDRVRKILKARRLRKDFFRGDIFADPPWEILLILMEAHLSKERMTVSKICDLTEIPFTTVLRWVSNLETQGAICKSNDPTDGRRIFIRLSRDAVSNMRNWYAAVYKP